MCATGGSPGLPGAVPYAPSATTDTTNASNISSGTLGTARLPTPFASGTASGNTSKFATTSGTLNNGNCVRIDASGNLVDSGTGCAGAPTSAALDTLLGATPNLFAVRGASIWQQRAIAGSDLPNPSATTLGGIFSLPGTAANEVLSGIGNDGTPTRATTTGTGNVARAVSPTFATSVSVNGIVGVTSNSSGALVVGRQGITQPALTVDASMPSSITGLSVSAQATGNGVNLTSTGEANVPIIVNAAGSGTINFQTTGTGSVNSFRNVNVVHDSTPTITLGAVGGTVAHISTPGTSGLAITTGGVTDQVKINHTASADRQLTLTGSNGGNPAISATAGDVSIGTNLRLPTAQFTGDPSGFIAQRALSVQNSGDTNDSATGSGSYRAYNRTYTIPANFLTSARALRITAHYRVTTGTAAPALEIQLKVGGTVVAHYGPNTPANNVVNSQLTNQWILQATAAPGASVNTETAMISNANGIGSATVESDTAQPVALATNGTLVITIESRWATAGTGTNQLKLSQFIVEAIN
jgi:hypothetical protein